MIETEISKAFVENGLGVGLAMVVSTLFFMVIKHVLKQQEKIMDMATKQNEHWQNVISVYTTQSREAVNQIHDAHRYQREEHKEMMANQREHGETLVLINQSLKSLNESLTSKG